MYVNMEDHLTYINGKPNEDFQVLPPCLATICGLLHSHVLATVRYRSGTFNGAGRGGYCSWKHRALLCLVHATHARAAIHTTAVLAALDLCTDSTVTIYALTAP
jgi:hypothetical protein